jgi:hypothetical protein
VAANRNNREIKILINLKKTNDIPKVNRDKSAVSASPDLRPSPELLFVIV